MTVRQSAEHSVINWMRKILSKILILWRSVLPGLGRPLKKEKDFEKHWKRSEIRPTVRSTEAKRILRNFKRI